MQYVYEHDGTSDKIPANSSSFHSPHSVSGNQDSHQPASCSKGPCFSMVVPKLCTTHCHAVPCLSCQQMFVEICVTQRSFNHLQLFPFFLEPPKPPKSPAVFLIQAPISLRINQLAPELSLLASSAHYCPLEMTAVVSVLITVSNQSSEQVWIIHSFLFHSSLKFSKPGQAWLAVFFPTEEHLGKAAALIQSRFSGMHL